MCGARGAECVGAEWDSRHMQEGIAAWMVEQLRDGIQVLEHVRWVRHADAQHAPLGHALEQRRQQIGHRRANVAAVRPRVLRSEPHLPGESAGRKCAVGRRSTAVQCGGGSVAAAEGGHWVMRHTTERSRRAGDSPPRRAYLDDTLCKRRLHARGERRWLVRSQSATRVDRLTIGA
jgi:hypothetical protein